MPKTVRVGFASKMRRFIPSGTPSEIKRFTLLLSINQFRVIRNI